MVVYTGFRDGYMREATWGTTAIDAAEDVAFKFGQLSDIAIHPSPECALYFREPGVGVVETPENEVTKGPYALTGMYTLIPFNGILLADAMGKCSTTNVGAVYTHAIVAPVAVSGVIPPLKSFTIYHEMTGTAADWVTLYKGCKVNQLTLTCDYKKRALFMIVDWIGKSANKIAFTLTADIDEATGTTETPYLFGNMTRVFDGNALDGLTGMELRIINEIAGEYAHTYDTGTYTGQWPYLFTEGNRKIYELDLTYSPGASTLWDELIASGNTKDLVFKWTKSADDYIQITCTDCHVKAHTMETPRVGEELLAKVQLEVRSLVIEVKDGIAGGLYGE